MGDRKKEPSQRQLKVGETLRHALSDTFMRGDMYDPETNETLSVTVSEVRVSPDLRNATVFVMPLAGKNEERVLETLERIAPYIRSLLSKQVHLRHVPALKFKLDTLFNTVSSLDAILHSPEVQRDLKPKNDEV